MHFQIISFSIHLHANGIQLTCSEISCNAHQSLVCEESLINGDWEISFNSIFLIQTKILTQTHVGSPALLLCLVHYFLNFHSEHYVLSSYFPGFLVYTFLLLNFF